LKSIDSTAPKTGQRINEQSDIFISILEAVHEKKGSNVISMNLEHIPEAVADIFIICEASNIIQLNAIKEEIFDKVRENCSEKPYRMDGKKGEEWLILDYVNIVVHCMLPKARNFYKLEELWHDAKHKEHSIQ